MADFTSILTQRKWSFRVQLQDLYGKRFDKQFEADPEGTTIAEEFGNVQSMAVWAADTLEAITDLTVVGVSVSLGYPEDAYDGTGTGDGSNAASVICNLTDSNKTATHYIPGASQAIFLDTTGANAAIVNISNTDLQSYFAMFKVAGISTFGKLTLSDGETLRADNPIVSGIKISKSLNWK